VNHPARDSDSVDQYHSRTIDCCSNFPIFLAFDIADENEEKRSKNRSGGESGS
jgi:hypothetical protein